VILFPPDTRGPFVTPSRPPPDSCIRIALSNFRRCRSRREADVQWICRARTCRVIDSLRATSRSSLDTRVIFPSKNYFIQSRNDSRLQQRFSQFLLERNFFFFLIRKLIRQLVINGLSKICVGVLSIGVFTTYRILIHILFTLNAKSGYLIFNLK